MDIVFGEGSPPNPQPLPSDDQGEGEIWR